MMYNINVKKTLYKFGWIVFALFLPVASFAQGSSVKLENPITTSTVNEFIRVILVGVIRIGMPVVALAIIYCGFLFVAARGNSEKLTKAKDALLYTIIGAAILLGSWALAQLISETVRAL